jgi:hypothetical protein
MIGSSPRDKFTLPIKLAATLALWARLLVSRVNTV